MSEDHDGGGRHGYDCSIADVSGAETVRSKNPGCGGVSSGGRFLVPGSGRHTGARAAGILLEATKLRTGPRPRSFRARQTSHSRVAYVRYRMDRALLAGCADPNGEYSCGSRASPRVLVAERLPDRLRDR